MNARTLFLSFLALPLFLAGCRGCDDQTNKVKPVLAVTPTQINFGRVKAGGGMGEAVVKLSAQSNTSVAIDAITVEDGPIAGTAAAYKIVTPPDSVPSLNSTTFTVQFAPTELQAYEATLVISSNDPERPRFEVPLNGEGAHPLMRVTPECSDALFCKGTVVLDPPSIDFGKEPLSRQTPTPVTELPKVNVINDSEVPLEISHLGIEGEDADAFTIEANGTIPETLHLEGGEGVNLSIRFVPTSADQTDYSAEMVLRGDDPDHPEVRVALTGKLDPNQPPVVCANIIKVIPGLGGGQKLYNSAADWAPLLTVPPGGYDFSLTRDIDPKALITFSALSSTDATTCTTDPEDKRAGLSYQWTLTKWPEGAQMAELGNKTSDTATLKPTALGEYEVTLTVTDAGGGSTSVPIRFNVVYREDLVVQLSWNGSEDYAHTDLDLHLVRPGSEPFSFFDEGSAAKTSGDLNGVSHKYQQDNAASGVNFDWGGPGSDDDPRLNFDDQGGGDLIENISMNYPERDPACATGPCRYGIYVHYFKDDRGQSGTGCTVDGTTCKDGEVCDCTMPGDRCVAADAPKGAAATGVGKCYPAPEPVVKVFVKGNPTPAAVIPLDKLNPPDSVKVGAPCQMLHLADILWPAASSIPTDGGMGPPPDFDRIGTDANGRIVAPEITRYGIRLQGGLECTANIAYGSSSLDNWYAPEPR